MKVRFAFCDGLVVTAKIRLPYTRPACILVREARRVVVEARRVEVAFADTDLV
jgi:hypothetical protein